ncbi:DNA mismatch repair endonuclease MutL [Thalassoglobus polymorphus]|uniref:DNA mismatch repair protein MutL n=1 Tax=Thalassoglobus polymorphus TaxID=2527994 RepID=A0A517QJ01_9PLAN|nr:DNA mismatch repair endonuclease MutL [Thalassoglobus polymorphus]QDT31630.1 DNA mismatch repair protein MutL [Thalassoglobus polymorphus]
MSSTHTDVETRIHQLSASVINKIAAGEVIERPASVVKELLENSVDALSTRIEVDIEQGGAELIRIVDDGEGIHPDDIELSIASHATSKIADADDLFSVRTMGFRGEALASISEVSHFRLRTKQHGQQVGTEMEVNGGIVKEPKTCGCPEGTQIEVRQLFCNTPVRRKFLKTQATEFGHISEQFTRVALANPNLHMVLRHNGKTVYELPATHRFIERLELFYGSELAQNLIWVEAEHEGTRLWGYVAHPSQSKSTRKGQYLFLNGRWIQDRSLQHALGEGYRGLVMIGRQPIAFLFLDLNPELVDVNVHPTKSEVRFRDSQVLYRLMLSTLRNKFLSMDLDSKLSVDRAQPEASGPKSEPQEMQRELVSWAKNQLDEQKSHGSLFEAVSKLAGPEVGPAPSQPSAEQLQSGPSLGGASGTEVPSKPGGVTHIESIEASEHPASAAAEIRAMQIHDCYLVVESTDGLTVIDQHALHERIMYEQLRRRILSGGVEVQKLLIPLTVELSSREASTLLDQEDLLKELGLHIQEFGGSTIALTGYPTLLAKADPKSLLRDIVDLLESSGRKLERRDLIDELLHMMSCKAAIKAGQRLTFEEMESLLAQRHLCDDHHHCPHGRPTALKLSRDELDRQFGRLG